MKTLRTKKVAGQVILLFLWNPNVHCPVYNIVSLDYISIHFNHSHNFMPVYRSYILVSSSNILLDISGLISQPPLFITYYTHFILLYLLAFKIKSEVFNLIPSSVTEKFAQRKCRIELNSVLHAAVKLSRQACDITCQYL
jgi:hypothetical protein